jgi:hypothetical protein
MHIRPRTVLAASMAAAVALAGGAVAAPAKAVPACNLVTDDKGDGTGFLLTDRDYLPNNPNLDLVSGDIATNAKQITAVIRTDALTLSDSQSPTGRAYYANFLVGDKTLFLAARLDGAGSALYTGGYISGTRTSLGDATGVIDVAKKEVRITAPLSLFAPQAAIKPGTDINELNLLSQRFVGAAGTGATPSADAATGGKSYKAGDKSCVVVGK